jgi:hypothetical protein
MARCRRFRTARLIFRNARVETRGKQVLFHSLDGATTDSELLQTSPEEGIGGVERVMGIEPTLAAWEAAVLPLNYTRVPRAS